MSDELGGFLALLGVAGIFIVWIFLWVLMFVLSSSIANYLHFTGLLWWAITIILGLVLAGIISKLLS